MPLIIQRACYTIDLSRETEITKRVDTPRMEAGAKAPAFLIRKGNQNTSAVRPVPLPVPALQAEWHPSAIAVSVPLCEGVCANTYDARSYALGPVDFSAG